MRIREFNGTGNMAIEAASIVKDELQRKPEMLFCAATGQSPLPLYKQLAIEHENNNTLFQQFRLIPLDEWIGLPTYEGSCHAYLKKHVLDPLKITEDRYLKFNPRVDDLELECQRIQGFLKQHGPIDLCVLGLGKNGHLGLNEPTPVLREHCHVADLAAQSRGHNMLDVASDKPTQGLTLGMKDILSSNRILFIISGDGKEVAKKAFFSKKIDPQCPATYLWQHSNVDCLVVI